MENKWKFATFAAVAVLLVVLVTSVNTVNNQNAELQDQAEALEELQGLAAQVATLEARESELSNQVSDLTEDLEDTRSSLDASEDEVAALQQELESKQEELRNLQEAQKSVYDEMGEVLDELRFGESVTFSLDDSDLTQLSDSELSFDNEDYDYSERVFANTDLVIATNGLGYDEDFGAEPRLVTLDENAISYELVFDEPVDVTNVDYDEPLVIRLLGEEYRIVSIDSNEIEFDAGERVGLNAGETVEIDGRNVTVHAVSENDRVHVSVDGHSEIVDLGSNEQVNGLRVRVLTTFSSSSAEFAELLVGDYTEQENGEEFFVDENFYFEYNLVGSDLYSFTVTFDVKADEHDDDFSPLSVGDSIVFPHGFFAVEFAEVTDVEYSTYTFEFDDMDARDDLTADTNMVVVEGDDESISIDGENVDRVYLTNTGEIYYFNEDGDFTLAADTQAVMQTEDYEALLYVVGTSVVVEEESGNTLVLNTHFAGQHLGSQAEDAEGSDVVYDGRNLGGVDNDVLLADGLVVESVEANADDDTVAVQVPSEVVEAFVLVQ